MSASEWARIQDENDELRYYLRIALAEVGRYERNSKNGSHLCFNVALEEAKKYMRELDDDE